MTAPKHSITNALKTGKVLIILLAPNFETPINFRELEIEETSSKAEEVFFFKLSSFIQTPIIVFLSIFAY